MAYQFIKGNFNNFYLERGLRKTSITIELIFRITNTIINNTDWTLHITKPIWISTPKEEKYFGKLEEAFEYLRKMNKFALFITLQHKKKQYKVFIRWYDNDPQVDVLSIEGAFSIEEEKIISLTPAPMLKNIVNMVSKALKKQVSLNDTRELNLTFLGDMKNMWLSQKLLKE